MEGFITLRSERACGVANKFHNPKKLSNVVLVTDKIRYYLKISVINLVTDTISITNLVTDTLSVTKYLSFTD